MYIKYPLAKISQQFTPTKNNIFTVVYTKTTISFCPARKNSAINVYGLISTTFTVKVFSQKLQQKPFDKNNIK